MSEDPCTVDLSQYSIDDAYNYVKQCAQLVYRELMIASSYSVINRALSALASRIVNTNPSYKVLETPRRIEFSSKLTDHRYAPYPILMLAAPHTVGGTDLPLRYDTIPSVSIDPRRLTVDYSDAIKELIEKAKRYIAIIRWFDGRETRHDLELKTDISIILGFDGWIYRMSYDKDYPPVEPPELYIEGFLHKAGDLSAEGWEIDMIECNVIGYKETGGNYYSGYGGVAIFIYNEIGTINRVRVLGREIPMSSYSQYAVVFSNIFTLWAYVPKT